MTSMNEFSKTTDDYASALLKAQDDIAKFYASDTGAFLEEGVRHARFIGEHPEVAVENVRTFVRDNPDAVLRFSAGCLALFKVMAQKRSRDRHPAGKGTKKPKLSVVEKHDLAEATDGLSFEEAVVDGWDPSRAMMQPPNSTIPKLRIEDSEDVRIYLDVLCLESSDMISAEGEGKEMPEGDRIAKAYLLDVTGALRKDNLSNALEMLELMQTSVSVTAQHHSKRIIGRLTERYGA